MIDLSRYQTAVARTAPMRLNGRVAQVVGLIVESIGPPARIGEVCFVHTSRHRPPLPAEVVGFRGNRVLLMPLATTAHIAHGAEVVSTGRPFTIRASRALLGRILDALGRPIDGGGIIASGQEVPVDQAPPPPLQRQRIAEPLPLGIRAIDAFLTCGKGQRLGIFSGSGVGKSSLLGMIARHSTADVNVIGLIGERGREVGDFVRSNLPPETLARSVLVVSTSDQPPILRLKAAFTTTTIAEYFRALGLHVLLTIDSLTRIAWAQREIGLAVGEPPTTRGYTPSVFSTLPRLLERSGPGPEGTITALYTVLVEGDDLNEPVADTTRGILDGHIVLSRALAEQAHFPAVDVLASISRLMPHITSDAHRRGAHALRRVLATYRASEDLINIGAYSPGTNADIDRATALIQPIRSFLIQGVDERAEWKDTLSRLEDLARRAEPAAT